MQPAAATSVVSGEPDCGPPRGLTAVGAGFTVRVLRGGSFNNTENNLRAGNRSSDCRPSPSNHFQHVWLRRCQMGEALPRFATLGGIRHRDQRWSAIASRDSPRTLAMSDGLRRSMAA